MYIAIAFVKKLNIFMEIEKNYENRNVEVACVFCLTLVSTEDAQNIQGARLS